MACAITLVVVSCEPTSFDVDGVERMIDPWIRAEIRRLYLAEKWKIGTIARQLGVHHSTVRRALAGPGFSNPPPRGRLIDPYLPFLREILAVYPRVPASRLFAMVQERGYRGGPDHFRHLIATMRPRKQHEAYLRLRTLPAEQAQVDWAHFGQLRIHRSMRRLYAFVYVLSYSRAIYVRFTLSARLETFLRCHERAFRYSRGVARTVLYDNLRSAVLERQGSAIRFHPVLLDFANHYRFLPKAAAPGRGNEKGRVERAIRFLRTAFFAARTITTLDRLNAEALAWCQRSNQRRWPDDKNRTVASALEEEQSRLIGLPEDDFPTEERVEIRVPKTPFVRFDGNDYSLPPTHVQTSVVLLASEHEIRILNGETVLAVHRRSYSKGEQIQDPNHHEELLAHKKNARRHRGFHRLFHAVPVSEDLMRLLAERGENLGTQTAGLLRLLHQYGAQRLESAACEALSQGAPRFQSVRLLLEQQQRELGEPPSLPIPLRPELHQRDLSVRPHDLSDYDRIGDQDEETEL